MFITKNTFVSLKTDVHNDLCSSARPRNIRSETGGQRATEARQGQVGVGRGAASRVRSGQSRGGRHVGSGEWVAGVAGAWGVGCGAQKSGEE
jgi:hypothetical protein